MAYLARLTFFAQWLKQDKYVRHIIQIWLGICVASLLGLMQNLKKIVNLLNIFGKKSLNIS